MSGDYWSTSRSRYRVTYTAYPKPQPCKWNRMENGFGQCAPDTSTYDSFNGAKVPFCLTAPYCGAGIDVPWYLLIGSCMNQPKRDTSNLWLFVGA